MRIFISYRLCGNCWRNIPRISLSVGYWLLVSGFWLLVIVRKLLISVFKVIFARVLDRGCLTNILCKLLNIYIKKFT
jgi:hypothetical protein